MSQKAILTVEGAPVSEYPIINFTMEVERGYSPNGRPSTIPRIGKFTFEIESTGDHFFMSWAMTYSLTKNGLIKLYRRDEDATLKTYKFEDAYIMNIIEIYNNYSSTNVSMQITIYANVVELQPGGICHDNGWQS